MKHKKITIILFALLGFLTLTISCSDSGDSGDSGDKSSNSGSNSNCPTKTCADFATQSQAQAAYNSNKTCYKSLDGDSNGKACESLPK